MSHTLSKSWRRQFACRAATLGSLGELRSPKPAESRLRAELPAPQVRLYRFSSPFVGRRPILTGLEARHTFSVMHQLIPVDAWQNG